VASSTRTDRTDRTDKNLMVRAEERPFHFEVRGDLDRHAAEALRLEIRQLAKQYGLDISAVLVEPAEEASSE
jgi:hypothetical protein